MPSHPPPVGVTIDRFARLDPSLGAIEQDLRPSSPGSPLNAPRLGKARWL